MKRRTYIDQEQANSFLDENHESARIPLPIILADVFGLELLQAEEIYSNWLDKKDNPE